MIAFEWIDGEGVTHQLSSPALIEAETNSLNDAIDRLLAEADKAPSIEVERLRQKIRVYDNRLRELEADKERWNAEAAQINERAATALISQIQEIYEDAQPQILISVLHDENRFLMSAADRDRLLAGAMTRAQRFAIKYSKREPKLDLNASRGEAHDWLSEDLSLTRPMSEEGGWFQWKDAEDITHRLVSPLLIEKDLASRARALSKLLPKLAPATSLWDKAEAVETASILIQRLIVLQGDLERFASEQEARENDQWTQWRSERDEQRLKS